MHATTTTFARAVGASAFIALASGCGGGDSTDAAPTTRSANQQAFEASTLAPAASYQLRWNLNSAGPQLSGTNYATSDFASVTASPLGAPQAGAQSALVNLATTLAIPALAPTRVLKGGTILVVPAVQGRTVASYVGGDVRVDTMAADGTTVALSQRRTDYSVVALGGTVGAAPPELARWYNSFWTNPLVLDGTRTFQPGAQYTKYTAYGMGDRHVALDCRGVTTTAAVSPCLAGATLQAAMATGMVSDSDGRTYVAADGAFGTVDGVPVWVAAQPRPVSSTLSGTVQYRMYFQLNGNVYTGSLTRDGAVLSGSYWLSNPTGATFGDRATFLPYQVRLNKAAHDSIAAAMKV